MTTKDEEKKEDMDKVMYGYSADINQYEEENKILKETISRLRLELERYKQTPFMVCEFVDYVDDNAMIKAPNGNQFVVGVSKENENLRPGDSILCEQKNLTIIKKIDSLKHFNVDKFVIIEKPNILWDKVGGLHHEANELKEVIELPLTKPHLFEKMGIEPPKGVLLYGPPGTGKTLMAKAVASSTNSTFIEVVGSELVQKFIGEGAKLVKEIFELAREKSPAVIFIDELDALAANRIEVGTSGEREVQRTFMQLLAEIDGFKPLDDVKIIGSTNRKDILDPAITRPGRLDRLILVDYPNKEGRKEIFKIHTARMPLAEDLNVSKLIKRMENFSGAEIRAVCTEAGYFAIRDSKDIVTQDYFYEAIKKVENEEKLEGNDYMGMYG